MNAELEQKEIQIEQPDFMPGHFPTFARLTARQKQIWFLHELNPNNPALRVMQAQRLRGILNIAALEKSINQVVCRHQITRAHFTLHESSLQQTVRPIDRLVLKRVDLRYVPAAAREEKARTVLQAELEKTVDLAYDELVWPILIQLDETEMVFAVALHRIVADGLSAEIFLREVALNY